MNRLFSKLKDFGLIFSIKSEKSEDIIKISRALKKADIPVVLFNYGEKQRINPVKISNENEDMFLGALCPGNFQVIKNARASGAHFIICEDINYEVINKSRKDGFDMLIIVNSVHDIDLVEKSQAEAVVINTNNSGSDMLIKEVLKNNKLTLFLKGTLENLPMDQLRTHPNVAAFIVEDPFLLSNEQEIIEDKIIKRANEIIFHLLGLRYSSLAISKNSSRTKEAMVFSALSSIPLFTGEKKEILSIDVKDMDRTIAHFKWKNIYMDPLSAKMEGNKIMETELYTDFLGWTVKLINRP